MSIDNIADITPRIQYVATAAQTDFDYPFPIFEDTDLVIDKDGVTQTLTTHYTVTGEGEDTGGTVTFVTPMTGGEVVTIYRDMAIERLTDFQQNGPYSSASLNDDLDRITLVLQDLKSGQERSLRFSPTSEATAAQTQFSPISNWLDKFVYINASGIPEPATTVEVDALTQATIGSTLYPQTQAESDAGVTPTNYYYPPGNVLRYGTNATPGTTDMTAAIQAAANSAGAGEVDFILPPGTYLITDTITFDVADGSRLAFIGEIVTAVSNKTAVLIGNESANTWFLDVVGLKVSRTTNDTSGTSIGVKLLNLTRCRVDIRSIESFRTGLQCLGDGFGFGYNAINIGMLRDNRTNLQLSVSDAAGGGYCNENSFYGGSFGHTTGYPAVSTINLEITHDATNPLNNNRFWGPSLEDHDVLAVAAVINGTNNVLFHPRIERTDDETLYEIQFTANSLECALVGYGFSYVNSNISDLGTRNLYQTREGLVVSHSTPNAAGKAVLALKSTNTSAARLLSLRDSTGSEVGYLTGEGNARLAGWVAVRGAAIGEAGSVVFGDTTQSTVGAAGAASALPAQPSGYLRFFVGTTEYVIPYYAQA